MLRGARDEAQAHLQARLVLWAGVLFWSVLALVAFLATVYNLYPEIEPARTRWILLGWSVGAAGIGVIWRFVLTRHTLRAGALYAIDFACAAGTGIAFACSAYFSPELHASAYTSLLLFVFVVFTRAIVVPSSAARTAAVSTVAFLPLIAAAIGLALTTEQDLPGPAFVIGAVALTGIATVLATTGSQVMWGLRKKASDAIQLGQYTLDRKIGEGGMGVVYRAHHVLLRRPTAIKLLLPERVGAEALDRFEREAQLTSQLTHPNTVALFDHGRSDDGRFYYAMEYLDGLDLEQLVRKYGKQPAARVVHILAQVCGALQEAHDLGLVHRDVKPANIILCERGGNLDVAKVVDFGLAKEIATDPSANTQQLLGTPAYLAPEAITAPGTQGPASDQYALGAVGYYLLAGRRVFNGANVIDTCLRHVTMQPPPFDDVPEAVASVILRALAKDPAARFASVTALAEALRAAHVGDWTADEAQRWWRSIRALDDPRGTAVEPTETVTLNMHLEGRA